MHIALVSPEWPVAKSHNGIVTYVHCLREQLQSMGHKVSVFSLSNTGTCAVERIFPIELPRSMQFVWKLGRKFLREPADWVRDTALSLAAAINAVHYREPIDVVEMEETFGIFGALQPLLAIPVVVKLHGPGFLDIVDDSIHDEQIQWRLRKEAAALATADVITSPCQHTLDATVQQYNLRPRLARVIFNPIAESPLLPTWRADAAEADTLLFVGRFDLRKGGDIALRLLQRLRQDRPALKMIFVGPDRGLHGAGGRLGFAEFAKSLGLDADPGLVYRGTVPWDEIGQLRLSARATLALPRWDNQPNTIMEAMQQGCPVVALGVGGIPEILDHGNTGLLAAWDGHDIEPLAAAVRSLLENPQQAARLGQQAAREVRVKHDPVTVARATVAVYREVLARSGST